MQLLVEMKDNHVLIKTHVNFDAHLAPEARKVFSEVIQHADRNVVLDLSLSHSLDSSGVGAIAFLHKRLTSLGFSLELTGLNEQALHIIHLLQINKVIMSNNII